MEKELDPAVIKATQSSLGKYVKRPPLTEKLLKKPPFRFLHDIVTTVLKTTGFFEGLFDDEELISDNVKDRESKISFLNKVIHVLGLTIGKTLTVKSSKIVAGQEPEKTNELLQCLAQALDNKLSSAEAVKKYKEGVKLPQPDDKKVKESVKSVKKSNDVKKLTSKSSEKITSNKREASITRNDKDRSGVNKSKTKENTIIKKESPLKKTSHQSKSISKINAIEKPAQHQNETVSDKNTTSNLTETNNLSEIETENISTNDNNDQHSKDPLQKQEVEDIIAPATQTILSEKRNEEQAKLNASYTIAENDLNSSLSSQDLMEIDNHKENENELNPKRYDEENEPIGQQARKEEVDNYDKKNKEQLEENDFKFNTSASTNSELQSKADNNTSQEIQTTKPRNNTNYLRPPSVRPSSSRPGAPRLREKHDNITTGTENLLVGKVNIIVENTANEEDEDSIIILEQQTDPSSASLNKQEPSSLSSNEHGHLVQQILDSQKEFSRIGGKTEIEWQFGAQKAREAVNHDIEQLRFNIQALSRVANPLGKVLDHIQEDVEVMRQELQQWQKTYEEASKELQKQKTANEDSLLPYHTKLKQLDAEIEEKHDKINDLKIVIHKNSVRIEKLLVSGNVQ